MKPTATKKRRARPLRVFYVYMSNNTDSDDDQVFKVKAKDKAHARTVALECDSRAGRSSVRWVKGAREAGLAEYKWWALDYTGAV